MASIRTGIQLNDQFTNVIYSIIGAVNQSVSAFENMQRTMESPVDVGAADSVREQLAQAEAATQSLQSTLSHTTDPIEENTRQQQEWNQEIREGQDHASGLMSTIKSAIAAYATIATVKKALDVSDELISTRARIDSMNDGLQTTDEVMNLIYASAQDARGSFGGMADVVARFGNNAKDAFSSTQEVVAFANLIQKQMTIAGTSTGEASAAMLQLSQALGSGVLRGDELNSIFEQAPNLIQNIADYLDVPIGKIREMASEGQLSADVVKAAIFSAADEINAKFDKMPLTWGQLWTQFSNTALMAFQPVLNKINELANSEVLQAVASNVIQAMAVAAGIILNIFDLVGQVGTFIYDNWAYIEPLVYGIVGALAVYAAYLAIVKGMEIAAAAATAIMTGAKLLAAAAMVAFAGATWAGATAQMGLNAAMYACPIVWIIVMIIALVAVIYAAANAIAQATGIAQSGLGVIAGAVMVVIAFFRQLWSAALTIFSAVGAAAAALGHNIIAAFHNAISNVQSFFYNLLSTAMSVISQIASALSKLPFVEFDASGLAGAADDYAAKAQAAQDSKMDYEDIGAAFSAEMDKMTAFSGDWAGDAFKSGASWGDGVSTKISDGIGDLFGGLSTGIPNQEDYTGGFQNAITNGIGDTGLPGAAGSTAGNTGKMADELSDTTEDLKYLRDIAEQEAVNRFTTAEIKLEMTNNNHINSNLDLDGVISYMTDGAEEALETMAEGVHV